MSTPAERDLQARAAADGLLPTDMGQLTTSVVHFYRGELTRMVSWRNRLDHTTNWAIAASAAMLSVTLSSPDSHHAVLLCCMALVFLLLLIEARRYRYFDVSRRRARLVEQHYFAEVFGNPGVDPEGWREYLTEDLRSPQFHLTLYDAMRNRLRRNYVWIYLTLLLSWWLKVTTVVLEARTGKAQFVESVNELLDNAAVAYIPGQVVAAAMVLFFAWMMVMVFLPRPSTYPVAADEEDV